MEGIVKVIVDGGPTAIAVILAIILAYVNKERVKLAQTIEKMHDEKEQIYEKWRAEGVSRNERLTDALHNSTLAMSSSAANTEALKQSLSGVSIALQTIMQFMSGYIRRGRDERSHSDG